MFPLGQVHTPDSSRYWVADSYEARHAEGLEPENIDKVGVLAFIITGGGMTGIRCKKCGCSCSWDKVSTIEDFILLLY